MTDTLVVDNGKEELMFNTKVKLYYKDGRCEDVKEFDVCVGRMYFITESGFYLYVSEEDQWYKRISVDSPYPDNTVRGMIVKYHWPKIDNIDRVEIGKSGSCDDALVLPKLEIIK